MKKRLVIAVTGTPGTGKSSFAGGLARRLNAKLVRLNELIEDEGAYRLDSDGSRLVNLREMRRGFSKVLRRTEGPIVVEGHLSHFLPPNSLSHVVVLRTHPRILEERLRKRRYPEKKVRDNVEAEAIDLILWEAVKFHGMERVFEIDTTEGGDTIELFLDALKGKTELRPGRIRWLEEYFR